MTNNLNPYSPLAYKEHEGDWRVYRYSTLYRVFSTEDAARGFCEGYLAGWESLQASLRDLLNVKGKKPTRFP